MRLNSIYLMHIRKNVYFNQKFAHPYYSSGNSPNIITLSYSVEYLTRIMFCESVLGVSHMHPTLRILYILGKKNNSKSRWSLSKAKRHETNRRFHVASKFCSKHKNPLYRYFYGKEKPAKEEKPSYIPNIISIGFATAKT